MAEVFKFLKMELVNRSSGTSMNCFVDVNFGSLVEIRCTKAFLPFKTESIEMIETKADGVVEEMSKALGPYMAF